MKNIIIKMIKGTKEQKIADMTYDNAVINRRLEVVQINPEVKPSEKKANLFTEIVKRRRVPQISGAMGDGTIITRQLDVALMKAGFKLSKELLEHLNGLHPLEVKKVSSDILGAVRELVGDHVYHDTYFNNFPKNVPDTIEFWTLCIIDTLFDQDCSDKMETPLESGKNNSLDLRIYGNHQHSYEEMLGAHEQFIPFVKDRVTILRLGKTLEEEALDLYRSLAGRPSPLNEKDKALLQNLADGGLVDPKPELIPVRENQSIVNRMRFKHAC